jgi:hypothetical protein
MTRIVSGGGINSNKTVQSRSGYKVEPKSRAMSPEAVGQQGASLAFARKPLEQGFGYTPGKMGATGIANARQGHAGPGPGGGSRVIYRSGSQSPTPAATGMEPGRGFDERPNKGNRP